MKKLSTLVLAAVLPGAAFCGNEIFSLTQLIAPPTTLISGNVAEAEYKVTNNTSLTLKNLGVRNLPSNVTQNPIGSGLSSQGYITCGNTFELAPKGSSNNRDTCVLKLLITGSVSSGPEVCQNPSQKQQPIFCATPKNTSDKLNVTVGSVSSSTPQISISPSTLNLGTGVLTAITITNLSSTTVNNVLPYFSGTALAGKVQVINLNQTDECKSIAPKGRCTLYLISYQQTATPSTQFTIRGSNTKSVTASAALSFTAPNPVYSALHVNQLWRADVWATEAKILSANYAFEGIQGATNGQQYVITAGGAWNTVYTPNAGYSAYTSTGDVATMPTVNGYAPYYGDAMPICFSWPILPATVNPTSFKLTLNTGESVYPDTATISPNFLYNERSCVVIFGKYGNRLQPGEKGAIYPVRVTIVNNGYNLLAIDHNGTIVSMVGKSIASGHPYVVGGGPSLLAAKLSVMDAQGQCAPPLTNGAFPNDGIALYGASKAQYRLRLFTSGGFALGNIAPNVNRPISLMPTDYNILFRVKVVANGKTYWLNQSNKTYNIPGYGNITISGLAALAKAGTPLNDAYVQDSNNQIDIVLYGDSAAMRKITHVLIPTSGKNPETGQTYLPLYNPGGPGNNPTPGVIYTQPGPSVNMPVTQAIDDPMVVNFGLSTDPC